MKISYITTPLYYINDKPHLGTAYSTIMADILNRYHKMLGYDTFLMTGTDEHGQKSSQKAKDQKKPILNYCNNMAENFKKTWSALSISYDFFMRTTSVSHKAGVKAALQFLYDSNQVYESTYEGWYCEAEEIFYPPKDITNKLSPTGKPVIKIKEKNYFFKMSHYQQSLIQYIHTHPDFIQPVYRKNEVLGFLKQPLEDLCISRPKDRLNWGIELPFNCKYVTYVWVDALLNYVTGVGYPQTNSSSFQKWWEKAGALHLIGKDILITHCVYWPALLMALKLKLPKTILAHGWLLNKSQEKMSKSKGDIMDPLLLLESVDSDSLRYFLAKTVPLGKDSSVSYELVKSCLNEDLSNNLGNLISRTTTLIHNFFESQIPEQNDSSHILIKKGVKILNSIQMPFLAPHLLLRDIISLLNETNQFLEKKAPWKSIHTDKQDTANTLKIALEVIYICALLLEPVMPTKMNLILESLSRSKKMPITNQQNISFLKAGTKIKKLTPLFPRIKN